MFIPMILAASMLIISDRANFWDSDNISYKTQYGEVDDHGMTKLLDETEIERFAGKKVMILVHGFATVEAYFPYFTMQANILRTRSSYDEMIGYLWPCYTNNWAYLDAKRRADQVAPRMKELLMKLQSLGAQVDVVAHSLGNRLVLKALDFKQRSPTLINNFLSVAPAVNNESLERGGQFYYSTFHCGNLLVFFSGKDEVLKWAYPVSELDRALGHTGAEHPARLPENVQMIDCTEIVDRHDGYLFSKPFFDFIHLTSKNLVPESHEADHLTFKSNGTYEIVSWRDRMRRSFWEAL